MQTIGPQGLWQLLQEGRSKSLQPLLPIPPSTVPLTHSQSYPRDPRSVKRTEQAPLSVLMAQWAQQGDWPSNPQEKGQSEMEPRPELF